MLYSQLYRSILRACRDLSRRPHYTSRLVISLPLLISVPSAYGAIVSPQDNTVSSIHSTQSKNVLNSDLQKQNTDYITTLDANNSNSKILTATSTNYVTSESFNNSSSNGNSSKPTTDEALSDIQQDALQAVGFEPDTNQPSIAIANSNLIQNSVSYPEDEYLDLDTNNLDTTDLDNNNLDTKDALINDSLINNSGSKPLSTSVSQSSTIEEDSVGSNNTELRAPTNPNPSKGFSRSSKASTSSNDHQSSKISQRIDDSKTLATSFEDDSVQKSLQRLAQFYQLQPEDLGNSISPNGNLVDNTNIIEAETFAPVAAPTLFNYKSDNAAAHRCEGVWVSPNTSGADANYKQAIQRAQQQDGLSIANGLPLHAVADYGYYDNDTYVELAGNVEMMQDGKLVTADQIALDLNTGLAGAKGGVLLADSGSSALKQPNKTSSNSNANSINQGMIAVADELAYSTKSDKATAYDVAFASVPMQAHGYAHRMNKPDDSHYELEKVMFSTCPPTDRKWQIEAQQIDIDTESGRGEAYDATFRLGKVPVLYLPYFNFPVDDRRSSGLLTPSARIDSESGLKLSVPYYLNFAPNYDATITTDLYTNRNPMLTGELRYLTDHYGQGELTTAYMPRDKKYDDKDRTGVFYRHQWASENIPRLTADAVYSHVSDPDYINDFDDFGLVENRLNLPRRGRINYYNDFVDAQFKVETFQSLAATDANGNKITDKDKPYSRLPQLTIDYRLPKFDNILDKFDISGTHDSAYFKKSINDGSENEKSGVRLYNEINATYPIEKTWGYVKPKVSLKHLYTAFDEESRIENNIAKNDNVQSAFVPSFSVDSGLNFYNSGSPFGWFDNSMGGYQLLSPRIKYNYSPYEKQSSIPNFDTRLASFDYDQLFADSWFLGHDRIADNNSVAVGLNYRYIDSMGITRFDGGIGDQYFITKSKVGLETDEGTLDTNTTGVAWRSSIQPYRNIWFDLNGALNSKNELNYISSQVRYNPTPNSLINLGVIERKQDRITNQSALSALTASAIIPINDKWRFLGQGQFDSRDHKFIDSTVGIDYEDCCYGFSIYGRSYYNDLNLEDKPTRAVMAEFRINGFGNKKSRLTRLLDNKILGFEPVDYLWKK
ncbi:LPS assembly protein LptD [Psychrobacter sp.]|uniref:LPS-assembly protein LptD n=1 Tax=Psychrobacter sp. TaxID=56811 RepID=UPI0025CDECD6|nr:LPS assembly protein LptD [Psychrobacter sp.]